MWKNTAAILCTATYLVGVGALDRVAALRI
jgi:hypothetical protein